MGVATENRTRDPAPLAEAIQKIASGPERSRDLSRDEARAAMAAALDPAADPAQVAVFLVALRMKRETPEEYRGVLQGLMDATRFGEAPVDTLVDIAEPYDGFLRELPVTPFLPAVLAACGQPAVAQGAATMGPKHGVTHRRVLEAAGAEAGLDPAGAAARVAEPGAGWAYLDQAAFNPALHALIPLRDRIIKRTSLTTCEVLLGPIRARQTTHLVTGYVHPGYDRTYAELAAFAGFAGGLVVRGAEGGIAPSLRKAGSGARFDAAGAPEAFTAEPAEAGVGEHPGRGVPLPEHLRDAEGPDVGAMAGAAAESGLAALNGTPGPARDLLTYTAGLILHRLGRYPSLAAAGEAARRTLDSGAALARFQGRG